ncbi:hypothetical protein NXY28_22805 [Bacteroides thetaiotaomicron]|nr:hypothetical protein NXY28_22805 [Bacteroides thetaiotaomicron]
MKKILKKSLHILCTTLGIIPFMLSSCNYLAVDEYFNDLTPLDSIFARQDYLERYVWETAALMPAQGNLFSGYTALMRPLWMKFFCHGRKPNMPMLLVCRQNYAERFLLQHVGTILQRYP